MFPLSEKKYCNEPVSGRRHRGAISLKIAEKLSGCFRSLRSSSVTTRKRGRYRDVPTLKDGEPKEVFLLPEEKYSYYPTRGRGAIRAPHP